MNDDGETINIIADLTIGKGPFKDTFKSDVKFNKKKDQKAIIYAKSAKDIASTYRKQLTMCRDKLNRKKYIIY